MFGTFKFHNICIEVIKMMKKITAKNAIRDKRKKFGPMPTEIFNRLRFLGVVFHAKF